MYEFKVLEYQAIYITTFLGVGEGDNEYGKVSDHEEVKSEYNIKRWHINDKQFRTVTI